MASTSSDIDTSPGLHFLDGEGAYNAVISIKALVIVPERNLIF